MAVCRYMVTCPKWPKCRHGGFTARDTLLPGSHRASPGVFPSVHGGSGHTETSCIPQHGHGVLGTASLAPHALTIRTQDTRIPEPRPPAPEDGRPGEGQRLTPDAPLNGGRPPPPGTSPHLARGTQPPQGMQAKRTQCWAPTPAHPRPQHLGGRPRQPAQRAGSRGMGSAWPQTPLTMAQGTPPGDALPPLSQCATMARKGARCGAGAGFLTPTSTARRTHGSRNPGCPSQRTGCRGREGA